MAADHLRRRLASLALPVHRAPRHDVWVAAVVAVLIAAAGTYYVYVWVSSAWWGLVIGTFVVGVLAGTFGPLVRRGIRTNRVRGTFLACALVLLAVVAMLVEEVWFAGP